MSKNVLYLLDNPQCCVFTAFNEDFAKYANSSTSNLFAEVDSSIKTCVFMKQIHSNKVLLVDDIHKQYECDGLLSFDKNIALCVLSADCLPLVLWHKSGIIAALHS
ncbi:laccase domain-containing protein, partial [Campylobacter avium]